MVIDLTQLQIFRENYQLFFTFQKTHYAIECFAKPPQTTAFSSLILETILEAIKGLFMTKGIQREYYAKCKFFLTPQPRG